MSELRVKQMPGTSGEPNVGLEGGELRLERVHLVVSFACGVKSCYWNIATGILLLGYYYWDIATGK